MTDTDASGKEGGSDARLRRPGSDSIRNMGRMMSKTRRIAIWAERIYNAYFSDPSRRLDVKKGEYILRQDHTNDRLYYIVDGSFTCSIMIDTTTGEKERLELFRRTAGGFVGVRSFFADTRLAVFDAIADEDSVVTWIGPDTQAVNSERYGSLREQFFPVIIKELEHRQFRLARVAQERVSARIRLHKAEDMATLGQFAAGLAHELNNTTSVLTSSSQHLGSQLGVYFDQYAPHLAPWFRKGMQPGGNLSSVEVRTKARQLATRFKLDYETAKDLVRMTGGEEVGTLPGDIESVRAAWATGRSCRDIVFASKHAANIIHSIKQLSAGGHARREPVDIGQTITEAIELLQGAQGVMDIDTDFAPDLPRINGNIGELMEIWLNIIKNANEAMRDAETPNPRITVTARAEDGEFRVRIANNGPRIPDEMRERMFQPSITSKAGSGNGMGLGLGLYIVKRLVNSYRGRIEVEAAPETSFTVFLPVEQGSGTRVDPDYAI